MILQRLKEYWDRQEDALPKGYQSAFLTKRIVLDGNGRLISVELLSGQKRGVRVGNSYIVPREQPQRTGNVRARLVQDNPEYVLGFVGEGRNPAKVSARHEAYVSLIKKALDATGEKSLEAIASWIKNGGPAKVLQNHSFESTDDLLIEVDGLIPTDSSTVQNYWAGDRGGERGFCLVTGDMTTVGNAMPYPAKGVPGGQSSGTMLVSVNFSAAESYGLTGNLTSPIGAEPAEAICNALNRLLSDSNHSLRVGESVYLFWTRELQSPFSWDVLNRPEEGQVRKLINQARAGGKAPTVKAADFFILALTANASRIVIRDYHETTLPRVQFSLGKWFHQLDLVGTGSAPARPPGVFQLAQSLYRDQKDIPKHVPVALMRCALTGTPIPPSFLALAVRRNTAEQGPFYHKHNKRFESHPRLALIKAVLGGTIDLTQLNKTHPESAYHCGRLLSVLESIQRLAIPGLNATLTDRHYGAACASPGVIFGTLIKDATSGHLPKLRKNKPGAFVALDSRLREVLGGIGERFPSTLNYEGQGLFALGYYHQRAHDFAQARANKEMKELAEGEGAPASEDENQ